MRVEIYSDGGDESLQQVATLRKVAERFPALEIVELPADGPEAQEAGIILPPGLVIDGIVLSIGRALSAGRLRRFLEQHQVQE
jgi:hypothetical protein